jgi:exopolyphosphatase/guanosine-5'-triphosphate,3'-diphosphate pyrophosphatase
MARRQGAVNVTLLGTEPIRRAADGAAIVQEIVAATNAPLHVLSHEEEAYLTLIGVTEGMPVTRETLVIDIGGGSSEFCVVDPTRRPRAAGLRIGSARLTDRYVTHDPPTRSEVAAMRAAATETIADALEAQPSEIVAVGGTASNLLKVLPAAMIDRTLTRDRVALIQTILAREPAAAAAQRHLINPVRARILPAGAAIMDAILQRYAATSIRVSESGVREGAILAVERAGPAWRDRLADLAHGWRT